ncbi:hypothetical protein PAPYR_7598 [Paratrimastix pyriformis]|uniref:Uncharacterized protein n=1 Tax=Paratrimastix pyriformis TaxID=342808 RepID=A0ABQ8UE89_9EUKA|nr:hypothetical protein PAPYR_7598 [Paratrimastix pyriformis]
MAAYALPPESPELESVHEALSAEALELYGDDYDGEDRDLITNRIEKTFVDLLFDKNFYVVRNPATSSAPTLPAALLPRDSLFKTYDFFQPEDKTEVHLSRQAFYERIFPKLLASWFPNTNHLNRGLIFPVHFLKPLTEYDFSAPICVELHKVLARMVLAFGGVFFSLTSGRCSDTSQTYRGLKSDKLNASIVLSGRIDQGDSHLHALNAIYVTPRVLIAVASRWPI